MQPGGRYQIQHELGRGGMGVVSLATDTLLKRPVAVKSIHRGNLAPQQWHDMLRRLAREAQAAGGMSHPNIVAIYDVIEDDQTPSIVMEYIKGKNLAEMIQPDNPLDPEYALPILRQCAAAIDHAEKRGIVHRDIKPSNIMIDESGIVKLTDFGIAKPVSSSTDLTRGMVVGTLEYMSPEQLQAALVTNRSDQYSLAVLAYRVLTGKPPFDSDTIGVWCFKVLHESPVPPSIRNPALPKGVDAIFSRALTKDPEQRYPSCGEFVRHLEEAWPDSPAAGLRKTTTEPLPTPSAKFASARRWGNTQKAICLCLFAAAVIAGGRIYLSSGRRGAIPHGPPSPVETKPKPLDRRISDASGDMVLVDSGEARIGEKLTPVSVNAFYIDRTEVTNRAYAAFCQATGHPVPPDSGYSPEYPVVNVSYNDAEAFARWAHKRIPTAVEWEKAARGAQGYLYPWGNEMRDGMANIGRQGTRLKMAPAESFPEGASPYGALNMLGNVWEWLATPAQPPPDDEYKRYQSLFKLSPPLSRGDPFYQIRGGSYNLDTTAEELPTLLWNESLAPSRGFAKSIGFRCARTPSTGVQ